jgi:hypothetical protein
MGIENPSIENPWIATPACHSWMPSYGKLAAEIPKSKVPLAHHSRYSLPPPAVPEVNETGD